MAITFIGRFAMLPGKGDAMKAAIEKFQSSLPPLPEQFNFIQVGVTRRGEVIVIESWHDDGTGLDALRTRPEFHTFIKEASECCSAPLVIEYLSPIGNEDDIFSKYPEGQPDPKIYPHIGAMTPIMR